MCDQNLEDLIKWVGLQPAPGGLCPIPVNGSNVLCFYNQYNDGNSTGLKDGQNNIIPATSTLGLDLITICNAYNQTNSIAYPYLLSPAVSCSNEDQGCELGMGNGCCNTPLSFISTSSITTSSSIQEECLNGKCAPCSSSNMPVLSGTLNLGTNQQLYYLYNCGISSPPINLNIVNNLNVCGNTAKEIVCPSQDFSQILHYMCTSEGNLACSILMYNLITPTTSTGWITSPSSSFNLQIPVESEIQFISFALSSYLVSGIPTDSLGPYWVSFKYNQLPSTGASITFSGGESLMSGPFNTKFGSFISYSSTFTGTSNGSENIYYTQSLPNTNYIPFGSWQ